MLGQKSKKKRARRKRDDIELSNRRKERKEIKVVIALGIHLYPFRTEKLSPITPMVLHKSGRVGSCRFKGERGISSDKTELVPLFCFKIKMNFYIC